MNKINQSDIYMEDTIEKFDARPSDMMCQRIENTLEGISIDHSDADWGEGRIPNNYSHVPDSGSNEPY